MNTDNILSYILLSGCNDNDILEDVLKYQKNPSFEEIVRIGTNLEVSRSIVHALPGSQYPQNKTLKVTGKRSKKGYQKSYKVKWGKKQTTQSRVFKSTNLALEDLKKRRLCTKCAKYKCTNKNNCIPSTFQCRKCFKYGHSATACVSGANNYGKNDIGGTSYNGKFYQKNRHRSTSRNEYNRGRSASSSKGRGRSFSRHSSKRRNSFRQIKNENNKFEDELEELLQKSQKN